MGSRRKKKWPINRATEKLHEYCRRYEIRGRVLSIGAAAAEHDYLNLEYFREDPDKFELCGVNIDRTQLGTCGNFEVIYGNAHELPFEDDSFDGVLCSQMIEHDPEFWLTIQDINRVLKAGGVAIMGAPGYIDAPLYKWFRLVPRPLRPLPRGGYRCDVGNATLTYNVHACPGDYYRFSESAFREFIFAGFEEVDVCAVMTPPRILGAGRKPARG